MEQALPALGPALERSRGSARTARRRRYSALIANVLRSAGANWSDDDNPAIVGNIRASMRSPTPRRRLQQRATLTGGYWTRPRPSPRSGAQSSRLPVAHAGATWRLQRRGEPGRTASSSSTPFGDEKVSPRRADQVQGDRARKRQAAHRRPLPVQTPVKQWFRTTATTIDRMSEGRGPVAGTGQTRARDLEDTEQRNAIIALRAHPRAAAAPGRWSRSLVARSLVRPLRQLRAEALDVAGNRLPEMVRRLRAGETEKASRSSRSGSTSTDEIGEVARAFDQVHREAVRLAADEAVLRGNINAMFVNLSRRSQSLVERQISLIDALEQGEQDAGRLARPVPAGPPGHPHAPQLREPAGPGGPRGDPAVEPAGAACRRAARRACPRSSSTSGVRQRPARRSSVVGQAVNDVVHLVAEIVENATTFSPRGHPGVRVRPAAVQRRRAARHHRQRRGHVRPGDVARQLAAGQPAGGGRGRVPADGPVRGRPPGAGTASGSGCGTSGRRGGLIAMVLLPSGAHGRDGTSRPRPRRGASTGPPSRVRRRARHRFGQSLRLGGIPRTGRPSARPVAPRGPFPADDARSAAVLRAASRPARAEAPLRERLRRAPPRSRELPSAGPPAPRGSSYGRVVLRRSTPASRTPPMRPPSRRVTGRVLRPGPGRGRPRRRSPYGSTSLPDGPSPPAAGVPGALARRPA